MSKEFNILIENEFLDEQAHKDAIFLFGLKEGEEVIKISSNNMIDIIMLGNIFKSKSDCRRNGWNKEIPNGFTDIFVGKLKTRFTIFKPFDYE